MPGNQFIPTKEEAEAWRRGLKSKKKTINPYPKNSCEYEMWNEGRRTSGQKITIKDI